MRPSVLNNLVEQARGGDPKVHSLYLNLTEACNLRCPSCHVSEPDFRPPKDLLDAATCARVVEEAADLGAADLYMVGGEPLLHREMFLSAARAAKRRGLFCETTTNGTRFDDELIEELVRIRFDGIALSLDGATAGVNDYLRSKPGVFEAISRAARKFSEQKQRLGSPFPVLKFNTVLSNRNFHQLGDFIRLASELGVDWVVVQTLGRLSSQFDSLSLDGGQLASAREQAKEALRLADKLGVKTNLRTISEPVVHKYAANFDRYLADTVAPLPAEKFFSAPCFMPFYHIVVDHQGVVHPCWNHKNPLRETVFDKSLREIFLGPHFTEAREAFLRKHVPSFCANCCMEHVYTTNVLRVQGMTEVGQYAEAVALCDEVLEKDPDNLRYQQLRQSTLSARCTALHGEFRERLEDSSSGVTSNEIAGGLRELLASFDEAKVDVQALGRLVPTLIEKGELETAGYLTNELIRRKGESEEYRDLLHSVDMARASRRLTRLLERMNAAASQGPAGGAAEKEVRTVASEFRRLNLDLTALGGLVAPLMEKTSFEPAIWLLDEMTSREASPELLELRANTLVARASHQHRTMLEKLHAALEAAEQEQTPEALHRKREELDRQVRGLEREIRALAGEFRATGIGVAALGGLAPLLNKFQAYDTALWLNDELLKDDPGNAQWLELRANTMVSRATHRHGQLIREFHRDGGEAPVDSMPPREVLEQHRAQVERDLQSLMDEYQRRGADPLPLLMMVPVLMDAEAWQAALGLLDHLELKAGSTAAIRKARRDVLVNQVRAAHRALLDRLSKRRHGLSREDLRQIDGMTRSLAASFREQALPMADMKGLIPILIEARAADTAIWLIDTLRQPLNGDGDLPQFLAAAWIARASGRHADTLRQWTAAPRGEPANGTPAVSPPAPELETALAREARLVEEECRMLMRDCVSRDGDAALLIGWLSILLELGLYALALELNDLISARVKPDPYVLWTRAAALEKLGRFEESWEVLKKAAALPAVDVVRATIEDTMAGVLCRLGRYEEAMTAARAALAVQPDRVETRVILGYALHKMNQTGLASVELSSGPAAALPPVKTFLEKAGGQDANGSSPRHGGYWYVGGARVSFHFIRPEDRPAFGLE
ncbi:MAG: Coenzyme PQQ synthesis protein E [Myxococcota bacterium]|nr:Coenzyme PQQ synthesis protein E [Myxococcota bacterium]